MTQFSLQSLLTASPLLLDGATGTWLQAHGLPANACPEKWLLDNPQVLQDLQAGYFIAGSRIVYAFTFGANRPKLIRHGIRGEQVTQLNYQLAKLSCDVRDSFKAANPGTTLLVAGNLAPTGEFLLPAGSLSFEGLVEIYREQVKALIDAGVDLFAIETMFDLAQSRAALIAIRELSPLPVMVSMTLEAHGRTLSGDTPLNCLLSLVSLGADAFGLNCSQGPEKLGEWLEPLIQYSPVPLLAKPNAGLPVQIDGKTIFPMLAAQFSDKMLDLARSGIKLLGGCCGTDASHIYALAEKIEMNKEHLANNQFVRSLPQLVCSARSIWQPDPASLPSLPLLAPHDPENLLVDILEISEEEPPAIILDFSVLAADNDNDLTDWISALLDVQLMVSQPLIFCMSSGFNRRIISCLVRSYHGRAGVIAETDPGIPGTCFVGSKPARS